MDDQKKLVISQQDKILECFQTKKVAVSIYLKSGIRIQGIITGFDMHVIVLHSLNIHQMIFKHAISTVVPQAECSASGIRRS